MTQNGAWVNRCFYLTSVDIGGAVAVGDKLMKGLSVRALGVPPIATATLTEDIHLRDARGAIDSNEIRGGTITGETRNGEVAKLTVELDCVSGTAN